MREATAKEAARRLNDDWRYQAGREDGLTERISDIRYLEAQRDIALVTLYRSDAIACADLCDNTLDSSGALLGNIRRQAANG